MKPLYDFVQRIIKELKLGDIGPTMQKTLELRVSEIVDKEIEDALAYALTEDDWKYYDDYLREHPDAKKQEALDAMLSRRDEIQDAVQEALESTYHDIVLRGEVAKMVSEETQNTDFEPDETA